MFNIKVVNVNIRLSTDVSSKLKKLKLRQL